MSPFTPLARIAFRPSSKDNDIPDLILGSCFKNQELLKAGDVWQIEIDLFDELTIRKVGESCLGVKPHGDGSVKWPSWVHTANDIIEAGGYHLITKEEQENENKT